MEFKNITVLSIMEYSYIFLNRTCESSVEMDDVTIHHGNGISRCRHWLICCRGSHCRPLTFRPALVWRRAVPSTLPAVTALCVCAHVCVFVRACVGSGPPARALADRAPSRSSAERTTQRLRIQKRPCKRAAHQGNGFIIFQPLHTVS